jgi:hypothetical protein
VLLFVGINFVLESVLLVILIEGRNKALLRHDNSSSEQLLLEYLDLQKSGGIMKTLFDYGLVSIPLPELREKIEYKIIQEYFVRSYNLPAEFKFANYLCTLLKSFVFSLIEVRPISWLVIACLVVLNYARIKIIDPVYESAVCEKFSTHFHYQPSHHYGKMSFFCTMQCAWICSSLLSTTCLVLSRVVTCVHGDVSYVLPPAVPLPSFSTIIRRALLFTHFPLRFPSHLHHRRARVRGVHAALRVRVLHFPDLLLHRRIRGLRGECSQAPAMVNSD